MTRCICTNRDLVASCVHPYCPAHVPPEVDDTIASLRAQLATAERERDYLAERVRFMTHSEEQYTAAFHRADRAEIVLDDMKKARDAAIAERDEALTNAARWASRLPDVERERDEAIRQRDARPDIPAEDAALYVRHAEGVPWSRTPVDQRDAAVKESIGYARVDKAIRAHAAKHRTESDGER